MKLWIKTPLLCTLMLAAHICQAQNPSPSERTMRKKPVWISMMNDTTANFYQTIKAFRLYYKYHHLPEEPAEYEKNDEFEKMIGLQDDKDGEPSETAAEREEKKERLRNNPEPYRYATEVKAFRGWYFNNRTWLRGNGTIIGPIERLQIVAQQQEAQRLLEIQSSTQNENQ